MGWLEMLILVTALGCGLVSGVFFAFSSFVMRALGRLPAAQGIAAMQSINVAVIRPSFLGLFLGTALASGALGVIAVLCWDQAGAGWLLAGAGLYLVGTFGVTMVCNVPRNDSLAAVDPFSASGAAAWKVYLRIWTFWNHVRTAASMAAAASLVRGGLDLFHR